MAVGIEDIVAAGVVPTLAVAAVWATEVAVEDIATAITTAAVGEDTIMAEVEEATTTAEAVVAAAVDMRQLSAAEVRDAAGLSG